MLRLLIGHLRELWSRRSVTAAAEFVDPRRTRLAQLERDAERAIEDMYDAAFGSAATARYSDAKEFLHDAIVAARELGDATGAWCCLLWLFASWQAASQSASFIALRSRKGAHV
jgi:hypothetical protein